MKVKLIKAYNLGTIVKVYTKNEKQELQTIPFDHRMFSMMWENLSEAQKKGKEFININY